MDVANSRAHHTTKYSVDSAKANNTGLPREVRGRDFRVNEIKIQSNFQAGRGASVEGPVDVQVRYAAAPSQQAKPTANQTRFNRLRSDFASGSHYQGPVVGIEHLASTTKHSGENSRNQSPRSQKERPAHKVSTKSFATEPMFRSKRHTQNPMVISMNCSKALTVTNYNELANLVSSQKTASANAARYDANRAPARYSSTEATENRN